MASPPGSCTFINNQSIAAYFLILAERTQARKFGRTNPIRFRDKQNEWCVAASKLEARREILFYDSTLVILLGGEEHGVDDRYFACGMVGIECRLCRDPFLRLNGSYVARRA